MLRALREEMISMLPSSGIIVIASKLHLCFLIVPVVMSRNCILGRDTLRSRGRPSNDMLIAR
jgi:hypothetical protein